MVPCRRAEQRWLLSRPLRKGIAASSRSTTNTSGCSTGKILSCLMFLLFSHINSCKKIQSPWSHKGAGALGRSEKPNEIKIRPGNTTLSRLKTHDTEEGAQQVKRSNVQTELTWPRVDYPLNYSIEFPVPTTNQLAATNYSGWTACTVRTAR